MKLSELSEDAIVEQITGQILLDPRVKIGPGDDCAVIDGGDHYQLLKADCVIEGVHFSTEAPPQAVGWKALCRTISDVAAMGGEPLDAVITVAVLPECTLAWLVDLYRGFRYAAERYGVNLVGGETSRSPGPVFISVALTGQVEKERLVTRRGGVPGDPLYVTGKLGGSIKGKHLSFEPRLAEARWLTANIGVHAMIDLSDGLASDLPRLAKASGTGFEIAWASLPIADGCTEEEALSDGEDYELLFAVDDTVGSKLETEWKKVFPGLCLTCVGRLTEGGGKMFSKPGYDHFKG